MQRFGDVHDMYKNTWDYTSIMQRFGDMNEFAWT